MAKELYIQRDTLGRMVIEDANSLIQWEELPKNVRLKATVVAPRNRKHSNQFFALLRVIFDAQDFFTDYNNMRKEVLIGTGYSTTFKKFNGDTYEEADSMAFDKMDDDTFNGFFDKFVTLCDVKILPNVGERAIRDLWEEILKGNSDRQGYRIVSVAA